MKHQECPSNHHASDDSPPSPLAVHRFTTGLSRQELADLAGISKNGLGNLERGEHRPRLDTARALAAALGVSVEEIFPEINR